MDSSMWNRQIQAYQNDKQMEQQRQLLSLKTEMGANGGATLIATEKLMQENPSLSFADAYSIAKSGLGQGIGMQSGTVNPLTGAPEAKSKMSWANEEGKNWSNSIWEPQTAEKTERAKHRGREAGETENLLTETLASYPNLERVTRELSALGKKATYTKVGQAADWVRAETGGYGGMVSPSSEGANARTEYMNKVRTEIFPILRQTFGAQFTQAEGEKLETTLGDPNLPPDQKDAALRAFIDQKMGQIGVLERKMQSFDPSRVGADPYRPAPPSLPPVFGDAEEPPAMPAPNAPPVQGAGNDIPAGAKLIGTSKGKKVYQLPDGSHVMEQ